MALQDATKILSTSPLSSGQACDSTPSVQLGALVNPLRQELALFVGHVGLFASGIVLPTTTRALMRSASRARHLHRLEVSGGDVVAASSHGALGLGVHEREHTHRANHHFALETGFGVGWLSRACLRFPGSRGVWPRATSGGSRNRQARRAACGCGVCGAAIPSGVRTCARRRKAGCSKPQTRRTECGLGEDLPILGDQDDGNDA